MANSMFELRGAKEMQAKVELLAKQFEGRVEQALQIEAERIMTAAKRLTPVDDGALRGSGFVEKPIRTADDVSIVMGFGGPAAPYAIAVHEHPSSFSPPSWEGKPIPGIHSVRTGEPWSEEGGRGPKFLERPFVKAQAGMMERIAKVIGKGSR